MEGRTVSTTPVMRPFARASAPRLLAVLLALVALLLPAAPAARAADVTFGTPGSQATYNQGITFTVPLTSSVPLERVELRMTFPGSIGPFINEVAPPAPGSSTLTYTLDLTGGGHLVPNTTFEVQWAAFPDAKGAPVLSEPLTVDYQDTTKDWKTRKGNLVTVHWYEGSDAFAERALKIGDDAVRDTAKLLGVTETDPIDFYIYADEDAFRAALGPGTRENVGGQAHADIRTLFALIGPGAIDDPWVGIVVPHELTHLVFDTAVKNPYRFPPRWLNEGLAVYLSEGYTASDRGLVEQAVSDGTLLPLTALTGQFPTDFQATYLAYAQSTSAIDFLVRTYGRDAMIALVKSYAEGLTDDEAFKGAIGLDLAGFQAAWLKDLGAKEPVQYGLKPYAAGPVPPGWDETAPGTGATASPGTGSTATTGPEATATPAGGTTAGASGRSTALIAMLVVVFTVLFLGLVLVRRRPAGP